MRQEVQIDEEGRKTIYLYDDLNRHFRTTDYDKEGKSLCDIQYQFIKDSEQVSGWKVYKPASVLFQSFEIDYNPDETEKETRQYNSDGELEMRTVNIYDEISGEWIERSYDANGEEIPVWESE
jgi:hypothetical protein